MMTLEYFSQKYPKARIHAPRNRVSGVGWWWYFTFWDKTLRQKSDQCLLHVITKERRRREKADIDPRQLELFSMHGNNKQSVRRFFQILNGRVCDFTLSLDANFTIIASKTVISQSLFLNSRKGKLQIRQALTNSRGNAILTLDTTIVLDQLILDRSIVIRKYLLRSEQGRYPAWNAGAADSLNKLVQILKDNSRRFESTVALLRMLELQDAYNDDPNST